MSNPKVKQWDRVSVLSPLSPPTFSQNNQTKTAYFCLEEMRVINTCWLIQPWSLAGSITVLSCTPAAEVCVFTLQCVILLDSEVNRLGNELAWQWWLVMNAQVPSPAVKLIIFVLFLLSLSPLSLALYISLSLILSLYLCPLYGLIITVSGVNWVHWDLWLYCTVPYYIILCCAACLRVRPRLAQVKRNLGWHCWMCVRMNLTAWGLSFLLH